MFRFKLQRVLDVRRQVRERVEAELTSIQKRLEQAKGALQSLIDRRRASVEAFRERKTFAVEELKLFSHYVDGLALRIQHGKGTVSAIEVELEDKISELLEARRNEQVMERLREKEFGRYQKEMAGKETAFLDEVALRRFSNVPPSE
ncbi:MAG: flagellar export protein FliJ [Deltaproteobacteria bacterium]|nr:flagellar export protein FliJ [Deltaproteobacteria bacterium]